LTGAARALDGAEQAARSPGHVAPAPTREAPPPTKIGPEILRKHGGDVYRWRRELPDDDDDR
jgi:hypothetical protein